MTTKLTAGENGRVDKELARQFPGCGRREIAALFEDGGVRVKGRKARKGDFVAPGDVIELAREPVRFDARRPVPDQDAAAHLVVLLERPDVLVIAKPAGMPTQPLRAGEIGTAASGVAHRWPECVAIGDDARDGGLVHRLDIGTSGALIVARNPAVYAALREAFRTQSVDKVYLAITENAPTATECDATLVQRGDRVVALGHYDPTDGLGAYTAFEVVKRSPTHALVRCSAKTGRMHQVRAHLANVGAPIVGDELYGGHALAEHSGFFLHAAEVTFPLAGERVTVAAPMPERFTRALAAVGLA